MAACALLVEEAGGRITDFQGRLGLNPKEVLATNGLLAEEILTLF